MPKKTTKATVSVPAATAISNADSPNNPSFGSQPHLFLDREFSWLAFNQRVLEECENRDHPLLERLKFLAISASNLDEFWMVRVASVMNALSTPHKQHHANISQDYFAQLMQRINRLTEWQYKTWRDIQAELYQKHVQLITRAGATQQDIEFLGEYLTAHLFPQLELIPFSLQGAKQDARLLSLPNLTIAMLVTVKQKDSAVPDAVVIPIPKKFDRLIQLPSPSAKKTRLRRFIWWEDAMRLFKPQLFPTGEPVYRGMFRIIRDSELKLREENLDDMDAQLHQMETALEARERGRIIRFTTSADMPVELRKALLRAFTEEAHPLMQHILLPRHASVGLSDVSALYHVDKPSLKFKPLQSRFPERIGDYGGDCFAAIAAKDIVVHHPYESFDVVVQFIRQATRDPNVVAIKQTLYRTNKDSLVIKALIEAAHAGKDVTVAVELRARFDEKANLRWSKGLRHAGAKVLYGIPEWKMHAKMTLITRRETLEDKVGIKSYVHFGTGNYHPVTARTYSDLSYFTCDTTLCADASKLFDYIATISKHPDKRHTPPALKKLLISPFTLKKKLLELIAAEAALARKGKPASIWLKMNALVDQEMIMALYEASQTGVQIDLVVRGMCCLKPGVPEFSENIRVRSIVGRFLEHARIFCFGNGAPMPSENAKIYIASADWMPRNLDRRIETMIPIENPTVHAQLLRQIMVANLRDTRQSWVLHADGEYSRVTADRHSGKGLLSAHDYFIQNPSLSGRGSALYAAAQKTAARTFGAQKISKIAVIDIGSNSVRLVIYDGLKRVPMPLFNEKVLCGLARGLEESGCLNAQGVEMAFAALQRFMFIVKAMGVETVYAFATSAVRDAQDGTLFIHHAEQRCNIKIQVLAGEEEANYAALGIASAFYEADGVVADLGGGSIELAPLRFTPSGRKTFARDDVVGRCESFPLGPLRLQPRAEGDFDKGRAIILDYLDSFPLEQTMKGKTLYAVGGGFRALAKMHIAATQYPLKLVLHYAAKRDNMIVFLDRLLKSSVAQVAEMPGVSGNRLDTLHFTALMLKTLLEEGMPKQVIFTSHGAREGLMFDKLSSLAQAEDALLAAASDTIAHLSPEAGRDWITYGNELFDWTGALFPNETHYMSRLRRAACILSHIAWHEHTNYRAEMAFRWILDSTLPAIDHWERAFIAMAVFHRYQTDDKEALTLPAQKTLGKRWVKLARRMGVAMRLANTLTGGAAGLLPKVPLKVTENVLSLHCSGKYAAMISEGVIKRLSVLAKELEYTATIVRE